MNFRKITLLLLLLLLALPVAAQQKPSFHIVGFEENSFDMSAREKPTSRDDGTGTLYSIIKVRSTNPDDDLKAYDFDFGYLKDVQELHDDILWVYVQNGAKTVTINREGYHTVERYNLKTTLQPGKVYDLTLSPEEQRIKKQMVMFRITPADAGAIVMYCAPGFNGDRMFGRSDGDGVVSKSLAVGSYSYKVISENYHTSEGVFTLDNIAQTHIETVILRANSSKITLNAGEGVDIYIDGVNVGVDKWTGNLSEGSYNIECRKAGHKNSYKSLTVVEGEDIVVELPRPTPLTGVLALSSTPWDARIFVDGKDCGRTPRNVTDLLVGEHKVEVVKDGYDTAVFNVVIYENETTTQSVVLQSNVQRNDAAVESERPKVETAAVPHKRKTVSGTLIDKHGNPVAGAKVQAAGGAAAVFTDADGYFSIDVPLHNNRLELSHENMYSGELRLGDESSFNNIVTLKNRPTGEWFLNAVASFTVDGYESGAEQSHSVGDFRAGTMVGFLGKWGGYLKLTPSFGAASGIPSVSLGVTKRIVKPLYVYAGLGCATMNIKFFESSKTNPYAAMMFDLGFIVKPAKRFNINVGCNYLSEDFEDEQTFELHFGLGYIF